MSDSEIRDVSDTALWVAAHRALESESAHAAFRDPLAQVLVGERGHALRRAMPGAELMHWIMVLRTVAIDELVQSAVARGADTVVNIGAGLDTRPYRLSLPPSLRWVEIDLPNIIALKNERLRAYTPVCRLERIALDITQRVERQRTLSQLASAARCMAVLTEGLLPYLPPHEVGALADALHRMEEVKFWIQDYFSGNARSRAHLPWQRRLRAAPFQFIVPDWIDYFRQRGWQALERRRLTDMARQLARRPPLRWHRWLLYALMPPAMRRRLQERAGYVMLAPVPRPEN
jgi:methyltransferase (TIGR00027 family)